MRKAKVTILLTILSLLTACYDIATDPAPTGAGFEPSEFFHPTQGFNDDAVSVGQLIYVPVYSSVYLSYVGAYELTVSLSIRNTDLEQPIIIRSVQYYNTEGRLLEDYLSTSYQLSPLATAEFVVYDTNNQGGTGANFLVEWVAEQPVNTPVVEAIMVGINGNKSIAFVRNGHVINQIGSSQ